MRKFLPYILIIAIFIGILSPIVDVQAQAMQYNPITNTPVNPVINPAAATPTPPPSGLQNEVFGGNYECGIFDGNIWPGCVVQVSYGILYVIPSGLLWLSAYFFNFLISLTLSSQLTGSSTFITNAWVAVRDISNVFFILILLYVAIELILGLAHDAKKVIVQVILMALLINFSMFFTEIIIDGTNILALVFYNKVSVQAVGTNGQPAVDANGNPIVNYTPIAGEKDVAGGLFKAFDPTRLLDGPFFAQTKTINVGSLAGTGQGSPNIAAGILILILLVAGVIMGYAGYCFISVGIFFMSRLIELWILIIFSPFAFMSSALPALKSVEGIGWDEWLSRLFSVSLMAPIFMFFLYLIFMMVSISPFKDVLSSGNTTAIQIILSVVIPALVILILLKKATAKAKKNAGELGTALVGFAKQAVGTVGGFAIGAATGGASLGLTGTLGRGAQSIANNDEIKKKALGGEGISKWEQRIAKTQLAGANSFASKSFDLRDTGLGKFAAKKTGVDFNQGTGALGLSTEELKGGRRAQEEHAKEKEIKKVKTYELSAAAAKKQNDLADDFRQPQNIRAREFGEDLEKAKKLGTVFNEKTLELFKRDYEKGDDLRKYKLDKVVKPGSVDKIKNANDTNQERRTAYANSLEDKHHKDEQKSKVRKFGESYLKGMAKSVSSPTNIAATVAVGAATGGIGLVILPLVHAIKESLSHVHNTDAEVVAAVRKGEDKDKKLLNMIKEAGKADAGAHGGEAHPPAKDKGHGGDAKAHGDTHTTARADAPASTPAADHGPADNRASGGDHKHG